MHSISASKCFPSATEMSFRGAWDENFAEASKGTSAARAERGITGRPPQQCPSTAAQEMAGDPWLSLSPHMGVQAGQRLSHGNRGSAHRLAPAQGTFCQEKKKGGGGRKSTQVCFMENIIQVQSVPKAQNKACNITRLSVKFLSEEATPENFGEPFFFRFSPPQSHVWSLNPSPRQQTHASKSLLSSETFSIIQQQQTLFKQAPPSLKVD